MSLLGNLKWTLFTYLVILLIWFVFIYLFSGEYVYLLILHLILLIDPMQLILHSRYTFYQFFPASPGSRTHDLVVWAKKCLSTKSDGSFDSVATMPIDFVSENKNTHQIIHVSSLSNTIFCYFLVSFDLSLCDPVFTDPAGLVRSSAAGVVPEAQCGGNVCYRDRRSLHFLQPHTKTQTRRLLHSG